MSTEPLAEERVGPHYDRAGMLEARRQTFRAIEAIAARIRPGMTEQQGVALARSTLSDAGLLRGWHGVYVRFGENTLCTYAEKNAPDRVLQENDIFYIDIGPIWQRLEGDGGDTFVVGNDPEMHRASHDVREIFDRVHAKWRADALTGVALYDYAREVATKLGWVLNMDIPGHRLADFPHKAIHEGTLASATFVPKTDLWVLEIQIRHPTRPFGAFFEDLMLEAGRWPRSWLPGVHAFTRNAGCQPCHNRGRTRKAEFHFCKPFKLNGNSSRPVPRRYGGQRYSIDDVLVTEVSKLHIRNLLESQLDNAVFD